MPSAARAVGLISVPWAPVSRMSWVVPPPLILAATTIGWPGVNGMRATPAAGALGAVGSDVAGGGGAGRGFGAPNTPPPPEFGGTPSVTLGEREISRPALPPQNLAGAGARTPGRKASRGRAVSQVRGRH